MQKPQSLKGTNSALPAAAGRGRCYSILTEFVTATLHSGTKHGNAPAKSETPTANGHCHDSAGRRSYAAHSVLAHSPGSTAAHCADGTATQGLF